MRVRRYDESTLARPTRRADGSIVVEARFTRTGVFTYRNQDGSERREYRPPNAVFDAKSMASFRLLPFTNNHPPEMITADNARQYTVGSTGENVRRDGDWMVGTIAVFDAATIRDMDAGKVQISNGYDADLIETPGVTPDGEHYDAIQDGIEGNHVALVFGARAGEGAAARMDGATVMIDGTENRGTAAHKDSNFMDLAQALAALAAANEKVGLERQRADKATEDLKLAVKRVDTLEAERDALKDKAEKADAARKDAVDGMDSRVDARVGLIGEAERILGRMDADDKPREFRKLSDRAIKLAVIQHVTNADCDKDANGKPRSDDYVNARFDAACETASDSADTYRQANDAIEETRHKDRGPGAHDDSVDSAYDAMVNANRNAWRKDGDSLAVKPAHK